MFRRQPILTLPHELVAAGPPGYLALATLFVRKFAIPARGQRAHVRFEAGPDL